MQIIGRDEEIWRGMSRFTGYQISSYGNVMDLDGNLVQPFFNDHGDWVVVVDIGEWMYRGPVWQLMLRNWYDGRIDDVTFEYEDDDITNCELDNMIPRSKDEVGFSYPLNWHLDRFGTRVFDRRPTRRGRRILVVEMGEEFGSVSDAAEAVQGDRSNIYKVLRGQMKSHRGYTYKYV